MPDFTLLCLPFAGGDEYAYQKFRPYLSPGIQLITPELPGKGRRIKEPQLRDIHQVTEEVFKQVKDKLVGPYAIFGHSMGAGVGNLLVYKLIEAQMLLPVHLFFSGKEAPSTHHNEKRYAMSDKDFIAELKSLGGIPDELLAYEELIELFLPILKADFEANDKYEYIPHPPYSIPVTVLAGTKEKFTRAQLEAWQEQTTLPISLKYLEGNHFFIYSQAKAVCELIERTCLQA